MRQLSNKNKKIADKYGLSLIDAAVASIDHGLKYGRPIPINLSGYPKYLHEKAACFVTLTKRANYAGA